MKAASSEGYLAQANHLVSTGVNADQLMEFEAAIRAVEHENGATWTDTNLMKLTTNDELTASAKKKAGMARTGLATGDKKYVSIVEDCVAMPEKPGSQEVTKYCMTQASLDCNK